MLQKYRWTVWGIRGASSGEKGGYDGKDLRKRNVLSLEWKSEGMMDDESGESMEPMGEVPRRVKGAYRRPEFWELLRVSLRNSTATAEQFGACQNSGDQRSFLFQNKLCCRPMLLNTNW